MEYEGPFRSSPWRVRFSEQEEEIRVLIAPPASTSPASTSPASTSPASTSPGAAGGSAADRLSRLHLRYWPGPPVRDPGHAPPAGSDSTARFMDVRGEVKETALTDRTRVARFVIPGTLAGSWYRLGTAGWESRPFWVPRDPRAGRPWRFLLLSDFQNNPESDALLQAVRELHRADPFHGILFAGDLVQVADDAASWTSGAPRLAARGHAPRSRAYEAAARPFFDSLGVAADRACAALLPTVPIVITPGNHEVSSRSGEGAAERAEAVCPNDWNLDTCTALFLPWVSHPDMPPGCFRAAWGPLEILSAFVARRWVRGNHEDRSGPTYEPPGRFIFLPVTAGSRLHRWIRSEIGVPARRAEPGGPRHRIVMCHHPPYAQGINSVPPFDDPPDYRRSTLISDWVPLLRPWADLVLSGHNHVVNHHRVAGVHYLESSHMGAGKPPARRLPDGTSAPEPSGVRSCFFASEEQGRFFSVLELVAANLTREADDGTSPDSSAVTGRVTVYRVDPAAASGAPKKVYEFIVGSS